MNSLYGRPIAGQSMPSWHEGGLFVGMHWIWWLVWVLTIVALIWAISRIFLEQSSTRRTVRGEEAAEAALRARFARGEIDENEYVQKLQILRETIGA